jgi:hypothetical protein
VIWCETLSRSGLVQLVGNFDEVGMLALQLGFEIRCKPVYMSGTREGLPMDVAKDARWQQEQEEQEQKRELDRNDSVRARLVAISQVEPVGDVVPVDAIEEIQAQAHPQPSPKGDAEDEFRRKLMSISYTDVPLPAQ